MKLRRVVIMFVILSVLINLKTASRLLFHYTLENHYGKSSEQYFKNTSEKCFIENILRMFLLNY